MTLTNRAGLPAVVILYGRAVPGCNVTVRRVCGVRDGILSGAHG